MSPRILILRGGAIGDFVLTLPALQALRCEWPGAYVELVGYPHIANLAAEGALVDRVVSIDRSEVARFFSLGAAIPEDQAEHVRSFSFVLTYLYDPDGTVRRNLLATGVRQVLYCSPRVESGHAADHLMKPLESLAIYPDGPPCPRLEPRAETVARGKELLDRFGRGIVALHPGSGGKAKRWPLDRFLEVARVIERHEHRRVVFLAGEADDDIVAALLAAGEGDRLMTGLSLVALAGVLKNVCCYVGNDSGITHLAAALGVPVVALFGTTDPGMWGPRGDNVGILRGMAGGTPDVAGIAADSVLEAVRRVTAGRSTA